MFELPSVWNFILSTIVFFVAVWYIRKVFDEQSFPIGMTRSIVVFVLASVVSWTSGEAVDWVQEKIDGPQAKVEISPLQSPEDVSKLLKSMNLTPL